MKRKVIRIVVTALLLAVAWGVSEVLALAVWQQLLLFLLPYIIISYDVLGEAIEGNMKVFILFDKNAAPAPYYKESLSKAQKNLENILSDATLESMLGTTEPS